MLVLIEKLNDGANARCTAAKFAEFLCKHCAAKAARRLARRKTRQPSEFQTFRFRCGNPKLFFNTIVFVHEHFSDRTAKNAAGGKCIIPAIFPVQPAPHFKQTLSVCGPLR